jgi:hypothetical protein
VQAIPAQNPPPQPARTLVPRSPPLETSPLPAVLGTSSKTAEDRVPSSPETHSCHIAHVQSDYREYQASHDQPGDLHLTYSIPFSQIDLGETQVDSSSLQKFSIHDHGSAKASQTASSQHIPSAGGDHEAIEIHSSCSVVIPETDPAVGPELATAQEHSEPQPEAGDKSEDDVEEEEEEDDHVKASKYFPEASRFDFAEAHLSTPAKPSHNPLAHLAGTGIGTGLSMSQVFNAASSPADRARRLDSQPPPSPSITAAGMMARSMPLAPTIWDEFSSPARKSSPARRGTTEPPEFPRLARDSSNLLSPTKGTTDKTESLVRPHTSPVPFSSPPIHLKPVFRVVKSDSDDDLRLSMSQERRWRVAVKQKEGERQARKFIRAASGNLNALKPIKVVKKEPSKEFERSSKQTMTKRVVVVDMADGDETGDDTGAESQDQRVSPLRRGQGEAAGAGVSVAAAPMTHVPASPPTEQPPKGRPFSGIQSIVDLGAAWDELHAPPKLTARPKPHTNSRRSQASSEATLQHANSLSAELELPNSTRPGTSANPTSLAQMVPFNIPVLPLTPPERIEGASNTIPEFIRESSGLVPLTSQVPSSSLTPNPSSPAPFVRGDASNPLPKIPEPTIPATSPADRRDGGSQTLRKGSPNKRRRGESDGVLKEAPRLHSELKSFAALNSSQPPLISLEDPDEVDMIGIVENVGAGRQLELEMPAPPPPIPKCRARKKRKTSVDRGVSIMDPQEDSVSATTELEAPRLLSPSPPLEIRTPISTTRLKERTKTSASAAKNLAHRVSKTVSQKRRTFARQTQSFMDSPTPMVTGGDNDNDIHAINNPAFTIAATSGGLATAPQRVFALFRDHNLQYHPATIETKDFQSKIHIVFDDGTDDDLERHCVRSLDLRVGDVIKVDLPHMKKGTWVIKGFPEQDEAVVDPDAPTASSLTDIRGHSSITIAPKNAEFSATTHQVMVTNIYLTKSLWSQFAERDISSKAITLPVSATIPTLHRTASPSLLSNAGTSTSFNVRRTSTPAFNACASSSLAITGTAPSAVRSGIFHGMIFALTFGENSREKSAIEIKLRANGGRILEIGFDELFHDLDDENAQQLHLRPQAQDLGFTAVIANGYSRRAKFLQALALGLPCLAARWVEDCVKRGKILDWEYYLLPAGESKYLGGIVRSRVLPVSDAGSAKLRDIVTRRRIFEGWNILAIGKGMKSDKMVCLTIPRPRQSSGDCSSGYADIVFPL